MRYNTVDSPFLFIPNALEMVPIVAGILSRFMKKTVILSNIVSFPLASSDGVAVPSDTGMVGGCIMGGNGAVGVLVWIVCTGGGSSRTFKAC